MVIQMPSIPHTLMKGFGSRSCASAVAQCSAEAMAAVRSLNRFSIGCTKRSKLLAIFLK